MAVNPTFFSSDITRDQANRDNVQRIRNKRNPPEKLKPARSISKVDISQLFRNES